MNIDQLIQALRALQQTLDVGYRITRLAADAGAAVVHAWTALDSTAVIFQRKARTKARAPIEPTRARATRIQLLMTSSTGLTSVVSKANYTPPQRFGRRSLRAPARKGKQPG